MLWTVQRLYNIYIFIRNLHACELLIRHSHAVLYKPFKWNRKDCDPSSAVAKGFFYVIFHFYFFPPPPYDLFASYSVVAGPLSECSAVARTSPNTRGTQVLLPNIPKLLKSKRSSPTFYWSYLRCRLIIAFLDPLKSILQKHWYGLFVRLLLFFFSFLSVTILTLTLKIRPSTTVVVSGSDVCPVVESRKLQFRFSL